MLWATLQIRQRLPNKTSIQHSVVANENIRIIRFKNNAIWSELFIQNYDVCRVKFIGIHSHIFRKLGVGPCGGNLKNNNITIMLIEADIAEPYLLHLGDRKCEGVCADQRVAVSDSKHPHIWRL